MLFKFSLALQNIPLSKQPSKTQPQIENEDVTWSPWYNMPGTRTNKRQAMSIQEVELDGWFLILHIVLETCTMYNSCTHFIWVSYFISIFLDWCLGFETTLWLKCWNSRALRLKPWTLMTIYKNDLRVLFLTPNSGATTKPITQNAKYKHLGMHDDQRGTLSSPYRWRRGHHNSGTTLGFGIWNNPSTETLKFKSPSKWNSYEDFNLEHWRIYTKVTLGFWFYTLNSGVTTKPITLKCQIHEPGHAR